jgi:dolichyl-diphosphooligosaccharide--protein glycosyltransferase
VLYGITAVYFSGDKVRLKLVLAPAVCCLSGVAISDALGTLTASLKASVNGARQQLAAMARGGGGGSGRLRHASSSSGGAADDDAAAAAADGSGSAAAVASPPPTKRGKRGSSSGGSAAGSGDAAAARAAGSKADAAHAGWSPLPAPVAAAGLGLMLLLMARYTVHCVGVSADMYSAPSIVLQSGRQDGGVYVFDDFREAYGWLRHNTAPDAKVASW